MYVSDFICDHRALHVSLTCNRVYPECKQIDVRSFKCITYDVLEADLIGVNIDRECTDVNIVVRQYDASLSSLLDKHAPSKRIYVVDRPMNAWMTDDILVLKALRRKYESLWLKTPLTVHFDMYSESCMAVKKQLERVNLLYETALLRVYNDIVTTVGKGNGSFLVLLDLSAAFDTIDHDNLFYILEKYVGIGGSALRLIRSYFIDRTQRVQIDGIMSDFASLLCGVPQGSVLGPMKFCL